MANSKDVRKYKQFHSTRSLVAHNTCCSLRKKEELVSEGDGDKILDRVVEACWLSRSLFGLDK